MVIFQHPWFYANQSDISTTKAVQRILRCFSVNKMQSESKKMFYVKSFSEFSAKTIDRNDTLGYTNSKEAIP